MKKQVIVVHGGDVYRSRSEYLTALKRWMVDSSDFEGLSKIGWRGMLQEELGEDFQVALMRMPNSFNARYEEWKIWFDKFVPFMGREVALVGHSLGGIFLAKYLSTEKFPKKIRGIFLVSAPFHHDNARDYLADFILSRGVKRLMEYGDKVHLYHSTDDDVVPFKEFKAYQKALPEARARIFKNRGHFSGSTFPELAEDIRTSFKD